MKQALCLIRQARSESVLQNCRIAITFENGQVVDVYLDENMKDKDMYSKLTNMLKPLTGAGFYGKLTLHCSNHEIPHAKIEKSVKLG